MSTNQPPAGQPEGSPAYAQPQDPWAGGFDTAPTDPVTPQPDPYGYRGDVWAQQTVMHPGQYPYVPQPPPRSRVGMFILIFLLVLVLGGGGGFAAWYITTQNAAGPSATAAPTTAAPSATAVAFNPYAVKVGDCLINRGTASDPDLAQVPCTTPKSYKVVKVASGTGIPEGPDGTFNRDVTSVAICQGIVYQSWYGYQDATDDSKDLFFCMTNTP